LQTERIVFGLTLTKVLLIILVIVAVWRGFAMVSKLQRARQARTVGRRSSGDGRRVGTIELVECPRCGSYFDPKEGCRCARPAGGQARSGRP
jgi:hypothetical protein